MKTVRIEDNKNNIVKKHNELIQKARYSLSEIEIKIVSTLISMIKTDDAEFHQYLIDIKELQKLTNTNTNDREYYINIAKSLMSKPFSIENKVFNWVTFAEHEANSSILKFEIHRMLKPYLLELQKNFTQYNIKNILLLKSSYVIRLYEYIISKFAEYMNYNPNSKSFTFELEIEELRELFEIPESYLYKDIRVNIIDKAQKQFKEKTNIKFEYEEYKIGRAVKRLKITVRENNKGSNDIFASRKAFINFIRKEYAPDTNKNHFPIIVSTKSGDVKVNLNGEIYLSGDDIKNLNNQQADKLWDWLYELVKDKPELLQNPNNKNLLN